MNSKREACNVNHNWIYISFIACYMLRH